MLSIIVCAFNRERTLEACLKSIKASSFNDYELIVVDDASEDKTASIAKQYADQLVEERTNGGRSQARNTGARIAKGDILVFVDSDVVVQSNTPEQIQSYFDVNASVSALTGLLSKEHPNEDFFSQYKNLYMNYKFTKLSKRVDFLFGSICAIRRVDFIPFNEMITAGDEDTELGQKLTESGKQIAFLKSLQVIHLKRYTWKKMLFNDFRIPFGWARIFIRHEGWKKLTTNDFSFAHAPKEQLASVVIAPIIFWFFFISIYSLRNMIFIPVFVLIWYNLNHRFFMFLFQEKGIVFGLASIPMTLLDQFVMSLGIFSGTAFHYWNLVQIRLKGRERRKIAPFVAAENERTD